ncbi:ABC transporter permease [Rhodoferax koreense]|uniref:ABC transporter permease n=1 Tax=Rhodoferax koreensis TaxID=1842727 RepID=A0A1P8JW91_9BURK|nr:amino acid ABC transporter permease [Rhodoferax koreense]APW38015.1 ABC transporter permease [Rhodoferax koreense]
MDYKFDYTAVTSHAWDLFVGCLLTLQLSAAAIVFSLVLAIGPAMLLQSRPNSLAAVPIKVFVEMVRNTPFLVQIFILFFGLPTIGIRLSPNVAAILALTVNGCAYAIEIIRGGLESINKGQFEAGFALGLSRFKVFRYIILKPALRAIYPSLTSQFIFLMLTSSIASSITANELTHVAAQIEATTFRSFEVYFTVAALYLVMSILLSAIANVVYRTTLTYPNR